MALDKIAPNPTVLSKAAASNSAPCTIVLDNGLTLLFEQLDSAPVVAMQAWVDVGSADEREGQHGLAHLHEHMLFKGTKTRGAGEVAKCVEAAGGEINAWTSFEQTVYHIVLGSDELHLGLDLISDILRYSTFDADELAREIEVVVEEIQRAEDSPSRRISRAIFSKAYEGHPYGRPVLGYEETVRSFDQQKMLAFFNEHYRPEKTTLVVVGDFTVHHLQNEVEALFGTWGGGQTEKQIVKSIGPTSTESQLLVTVLREDVKESRMAMAWPIPSINHGDIPALDLLVTVLGAGESSRLFMETRQKLRLVNDIYAYAYTPKGPGLLMVGGGVLEGVTPQDALKGALKEVYNSRTAPFTAQELETAKMMILSEAAYQKETVQGQARKLGFYQVVAGDTAKEKQYRECLQALTGDDLSVVAKRYLTAHPCVVLQLPEDAAALTQNDIIAAVTEAEKASFKQNDNLFSSSPSPPSPHARRGPLGVKKVVLDNGVTLLLQRQPTPVCAIRAVCRGGQRLEAIDQQGLGALFGSVWGMATENLTNPQLARKSAMLGGGISPFSGRNSVGMRGEFIANKSKEGIDLFLQTLLNPMFLQDDIDRERIAIEQHIKNREQNPAGKGFDIFAKTLYPSHPYGRRSTGTVDSLRALTLDHIHHHHKLHLDPKSLVLSVVGDCDTEALYAQLAGPLSKLPLLTGGDQRLEPARDLAPTTSSQFTHKMDKKQTHIILGTMGTTVDHPDRFPLEVLCAILSGQSGRLFMDLRDKQSLAYSVSAGALEGVDPGHILLHIATSPSKVEAALAGLYGHLDNIIGTRVKEEELSRATRYLAGNFGIDTQRGGARAMLMALNELFGLGYDNYSHYKPSILAVTAEEVQRVAKEYLHPARLIEVVVGS